MNASGAGLAEYLKQAFLYRWNLLLFLSGVAAGALSPWPDAILALVLAAEAAYLGALVSIPKFRRAVDAQVHGKARTRASKAAGDSVKDLLKALPDEPRQRFESLRSRCLEMRRIARGVGGRYPSSAEDLSTPALDRLLWVFLKLLVTQDSLERFLHFASDTEIRAQIAEAGEKLAEPSLDERFRRSLEDSLRAHEVRLRNYEKARDNSELVRLELDRLEAKIQALAESSVSQQDPDALSSQIEGVAESVQSTETAIRELQQITGLVDQMQEPPAILEADLPRVVR